MSNALDCFVCGRGLQNVMDDVQNQPNDAVCFVAYGQYGSGVFDPMDRSWLEINICDQCLVDGRSRVLHGKDPVVPRPPSIYQEWTP